MSLLVEKRKQKSAWRPFPQAPSIRSKRRNDASLSDESVAYASPSFPRYVQCVKVCILLTVDLRCDAEETDGNGRILVRSMKTVTVRCCIAGGGPAGMMLGLLLARSGLPVLVLEKHADFLRDFRGDTLHPSSLEILYELGVLERFLRLPHQRVPKLIGRFGNLEVTVADFSYLPTRCRYVAFLPQWDFLNFLAEEGRSYPTFQLRVSAEVTDLLEEEGRVVGLRADTAEGSLEVRSDLVIGADGRHSIVREQAGLLVEDFGAPMDVLWFRLSRKSGDPVDPMGRFDAGRIFIMLNRGDYWQCGFVIPKGSRPKVESGGIPAFREQVAQLAPFAADRVDELREWDPIKLLTVQVDRLRQWWKPGLLCIGDAAHAMSPVGGVGINLAIQDAVAAANILAAPLGSGRLSTEDLKRVQRRREWPTKLTQWAQLAVQKRIIKPVLSEQGSLSPPLALKLLGSFPFLRRVSARLIGLGIRPEHVRTSVRF